jgi:hypothetical protein
MDVAQDFTSVSLIHCYYCAYKDQLINGIINHLHVCNQHANSVMKLKVPILCPATGKLDVQTKMYAFVPANIKEGESVICDGRTNQVQHIKNAPAKISPTSASLKRQKNHNSNVSSRMFEEKKDETSYTVAENAACNADADDTNEEDEDVRFLSEILPTL